jgi:hypothetical protein
MKQNLVIAALLGALACCGLYAQSEMRANIPFEFQAGKRILPAGDYLIRQDGPWVILSVADTAKSAMALMSNTASAKDALAPGAHLEFHSYGSAYFLTAVFNGVSGVGRELLPTSREKELIKVAQRGNRLSQRTISVASR